MDTKAQALPPLKRFRLLQQQHQLEKENKENSPFPPQLPRVQQRHQIEKENNENSPFPMQLPAKKRKESRSPLLAVPTITAAADAGPATYCLPAKKRVWALQTDFTSGKPLSPFDLNVEYKSYLSQEMKEDEENHKSPPAICVSQSIQADQAGNMGLVNKNITNKGKLEHEYKKDLEEEIGGGCGDDDNDGILCAICQSTDGDPTDPIVFCDGCNLMVHTTCYGNPLIKGVPEGDWFCAQCLVSESREQHKPFSCSLCANRGGAMKPTKDGMWAHVVCALLVPEAFFEDPDGREGIDCSRVPKRRWERKCYVCNSREGCAIECSERKCPLAFHVTCGLSENLCIEYKEGKKHKETIVAGFCKRHTELWEKQQQTGKFKIVAEKSSIGN